MSSRLGITGEFITGRQIKRLIFGIKTNKKMLYCLWVLVAMETHFHVSSLKYQYFEKFYEGTLFKIKFATTFPQYVL